MAIGDVETRCGCCKVLFGLAAECVIITLTILHVLMSTVELLIHFEVLQVPNASSSTDKVTAATTVASLVPNTTIKSSTYDPGGSECSVDLDHPNLKVTVEVVQYATLVISALFCLEMLCKIVYLKKRFLKSLGQMFDLMVVVCSLGVEVTYLVLHKQLVCIHPAIEIASYIIVLRLWRIPVACNIRKLEYQSRLEDEIRYLHQTKTEVDTRCKHLEEVREQQHKELVKLRTQLNDSGVYLGEDKTDLGVMKNGKPYPNGGLNGTALNYIHKNKPLREESAAEDGGANLKPSADKTVANVTVAFTTETDGEKREHSDLARKDSDVNSKANDSGIDAKDSFRSDIENKGYGRECRDEVFADSDGSETPVPRHKTVQKVEVQIEEPSRQNQLPSVTSEDQVILRRKPSDHFVPYFENAAYDADGDEDAEEDHNLSRTYRSADGVPMTEL